MREADGPTGKVAVKIILKKNVKGNEQMVYDELEMLQRMKHPHIVKFVDWFESRVRYGSLIRANTSLHISGQILYCHAIGHWWRAVRPYLRARKIHREGCFANHSTGS